MSVEIIVEDARWSDLERLAGVAVSAALGGAGLSDAHEVAVLGCDDARIAALNAEFRGKSVATNVLSWPSEARDPDVAPPDPASGDPALGDIAIAFETCVREAAEQGKALDAHVIHLLIHATLHLLGHDHETEDAAARMEALETEIVVGLGFPAPYASARGSLTGN